MKGTPTIVALLVVLLVTFAAGGAVGHTEVAGTVPANGERLDTAPKAVLVTLSSPPARLDSASVRVAGTAATGFARLDPEDTRRLVIPIEGSAAGRYVAEWVVTAADGHRSSGTTSFTVAGAGSLVDRVVALGTLATEVGAALGQARAQRS